MDLQTARTDLADAVRRWAAQPEGGPRGRHLTPHLRRLEADAIGILRETAAQCAAPVLLYSGGKDSSVVLHLARKGFWPGPIPFPALHVATGWDFADLLRLRDLVVPALGLRLIVHTNADGVRRGIGPLTASPGEHARVMASDALRQALAAGGFDAAIGGARRDEEVSRAKERIFSVRTPDQAWDPRNQRPELWSLYNGRVRDGRSLRVFPLSNWTETDVWAYVRAEEIPVVPLYFADERPVIERAGTLIMLDDDRLVPGPDEPVTRRRIRFRTLGCWPLTGGMASDARDVDGILAELAASRLSERQGRLIDHDEATSMERKKREGYF